MGERCPITIYIGILKLLLLVSMQVSYAQGADFAHYKPLQSEGTLPPDALSVLHLNPDRAGTFGYREEYVLYREEKVNYLRHVQYAIYELFQQGLVLFNDTASRYVQRVALRLVRDNPTLRSEMRFYLLKSPAINAFVTENGMAFVTLGLLARCRNEAQLAWVLSRLITHYIQQHRISGHDIFLAVDEQLSGFRYPTLEERLIGRRLYAAADQIFADTASLANYVRAGYAPKEVLQGPALLSNTYATWEDIFFTPTFLEHEFLRIPSAYFLENAGELQPDPKNNMHLARYVPTGQRVQALEAALKRWQRTGTLYQEPQPHFDYVAKLARYELTLLYLAQAQYTRAFYQAYLLELEDFNNPFLERILISAFYGMARQAHVRGDSLQALPASLSAQGQHGQLAALTLQMPTVEQLSITLHIALRYMQQQGIHPQVQMLAQEVATLLRTHYHWDADWLRVVLNTNGRHVPDIADSTKAPRFTPLCLDALRLYKQIDALYLLFQPEDQTSVQAGLIKRTLYATRLKAPPLPPQQEWVTEVTYAAPRYLLADLRKTDKLLMDKTLRMQYRLKQFFVEQLDTLGLKTDLLDANSLERNNMARYNQLQQLHLWLTERHNAPAGCIALLPEYRPSSRVVGVCQVLASQRARKRWPYFLGASVLVPPLLPAGVYQAVTPLPEQTLLFTCYDTHTGQPCMHYTAQVQAPAWRTDLLFSHIRHALLQTPLLTVPNLE